MTGPGGRSERRSPSLGRRSGAVLLLTALFAVMPSSPAAGAPVIAIDKPGDGQTHQTASVTFSGRVSNNSPLHAVKTVTLAAAGQTQPIECNETTCPFSWRIDVPANGPYQLKVTATEATILLGTPGATATQTRAFKVAAPPATPVLDPTAERSLTLTTCHPKGSAAQRLIVRATWVKDLKAA